MRRAARFPKFSQLPAELQLMIWAFAVPEPRVIRYSSHYPDCTVTQTLPGILHACYESRKEALKRYKTAFSVYFDFARDTLEFGDFTALETFSKRNTPFNGSTEETDAVRIVAITVKYRLEEYQFRLICSNFGALEELKVREMTFETWVNWKPLRVVERKEIERYLPLRRLLAWVRYDVDWRGQVEGGWKVPRVVIGTEKQWEAALRASGQIYDGGDEMDLDDEK
jgi:hypothetical protein